MSAGQKPKTNEIRGFMNSLSPDIDSPSGHQPETGALEHVITYYGENCHGKTFAGYAHEQLTALLAEHAALRERVEWEEGKDDWTNRRLHYLLGGECPAFPGSTTACNTGICDCNSEWAEYDSDELLEAYAARAAQGGTE